MNELALFAGAGGGLLGSRLLGWRIVCAVENDPYRQAVLLARQQDRSLDPFPIWDDVRTFDGRPWRGLVDVVTAGFPCPVNSQAARGRNTNEDLWPETARVIGEVRPDWCLLENVPGLLYRGRRFRNVLRDLAALRFDVAWDCWPACAVGAPHCRDRLWIVARNSDGHGESNLPVDAKESGVQRVDWGNDPGSSRMGDGLAHRVDRLAALGDGQVPAVVVAAWGELSARL